MPETKPTYKLLTSGFCDYRNAFVDVPVVYTAIGTSMMIIYSYSMIL